MDLKQKAISGIRWTTLSTIFTTVLQFAQLLILSRLLDVRDFGLIAIVTVVISLIRAFSDLGVTAAVIHFQDTTDKELSSLYWLNILTGISLFGLINLANPVIVHFYNEPELPALLFYVSFTLLFAPAGSLFQTRLQKELKFNTIAYIETLSTLAGTGLTVFLAFKGHGVWSLVAGQLLNATLKSLALLSVAFKNYLILPVLSFKGIKKYLKFGMFQMGERSINFISERLDHLIIGSLLGSYALGLYNFAFNLISQPVNIINPIINKVSFPFFSKIQDDPAWLKSSYNKILWGIMFINTPVLLGIAVAADYIVPVVFDPKWIESIKILQVLAFVSIFRASANPAGSLILAKGRADLGFKWNSVLFAISIPVIAITSYFGNALTVAAGMLFLQMILFYPNFRFLIQPFTGNWFIEYVKTIFTPLIVFTAIFAGVYFLLRYIFVESNVMNLIYTSLIIFVVSVIVSFILNRNKMGILKEFLHYK